MYDDEGRKKKTRFAEVECTLGVMMSVVVVAEPQNIAGFMAIFFDVYRYE